MSLVSNIKIKNTYYVVNKKKFVIVLPNTILICFVRYYYNYLKMHIQL